MRLIDTPEKLTILLLLLIFCCCRRRRRRLHACWSAPSLIINQQHRRIIMDISSCLNQNQYVDFAVVKNLSSLLRACDCEYVSNAWNYISTNSALIFSQQYLEHSRAYLVQALCQSQWRLGFHVLRLNLPLIWIGPCGRISTSAYLLVYRTTNISLALRWCC